VAQQVIENLQILSGGVKHLERLGRVEQAEKRRQVEFG
jgi:hypothetical protein